MTLPKFKRDFLRKEAANLPTTCQSLSDVKKICQFYNIKDSKDYRARYKDIEGLMAHPERIFSDEWISYYDLLDIPIPYSYKELKGLLKNKKLQSQKDYKNFVRDNKDPRIPKDPQTVYADKWENWYRFLGKEEPYKISFIKPEFVVWGEKIEEFMKQAFGGGAKVTHLCRFVRHYIEEHDKSTTPQAFLTQSKFNIKPFRATLEEMPVSYTHLRAHETV